MAASVVRSRTDRVPGTGENRRRRYARENVVLGASAAVEFTSTVARAPCTRRGTDGTKKPPRRPASERPRATRDTMGLRNDNKKYVRCSLGQTFGRRNPHARPDCKQTRTVRNKSNETAPVFGENASRKRNRLITRFNGEPYRRRLTGRENNLT